MAPRVATLEVRLSHLEGGIAEGQGVAAPLLLPSAAAPGLGPRTLEGELRRLHVERWFLGRHFDAYKAAPGPVSRGVEKYRPGNTNKRNNGGATQQPGPSHAGCSS